MPQLLKNNVTGILSGTLSAAATSMTLVDATNFPAPGSDYYLVTLIGLNANGQETSWEIVRVTAKASNTLTITRAQEGTTAQTWASATTVQMRLTAASVFDIASGGTGQTTKTAAFDALSPATTLGDLIYSDGTDNVRLAGNTTTSRRFLRQTGTGSASAAPAWDALVNGDIPSALTGKTYNGLTLTANATGFQLAGGTTSKTLAVSNSLTLAGTDGTTMTFPSTSASIARTDAAQTFTGVQTFSSDPTLSGGTANGVLYLNGSKVATSGSALTFDGTNLGVGATAVYGGLYGTIHAYSASGATIRLDRNGAGTSTIQSVQTGVAYRDLTLDAANNIFSINGSEQMRLTSTGLGIGTVPSQRLHVGGTGAQQVWISTFTSGSPVLQLRAEGVNGGAITYDRSNSTLQLSNADVNFLTGTTAGNVGIGTISPAYKLDVNGTGGVRFTGSNNNRPVLIDTNVMIKGESGAWAVTHGFIGSSGTNRGGFGALGTDDTINYYWIGSAYDSNEFVLNGGNVGIGTSSPNQKLEVRGTVRAGLQTSSINGTVLLDDSYSGTESLVSVNTLRSTGGLLLGAGVMQQENSSNIVSTTGISIARAGLFLDTGAFVFKNAAAAAVARGTAVSLTTLMTLDSSGNLGLGVTPSAWGTSQKAVEVGTFAALADDTTGNGVAGVMANLVLNGATYRYKLPAPAFGGAYLFSPGLGSHRWFTTSAPGTGPATASLTTAMTLDASGRLLVGYTSNQDGAALQIDANSVGSTTYTAAFNNSSTSTSAYNVARWAQGAAGSAVGIIGTGGSAVANTAFQNNFVVGTQTSSDLAFATNNTERARITSGGDLLVGTTTPGGKLTVNNTITFSSQFVHATTSGSTTVAFSNGQNGKLTLTGNATLAFTFPGIGHYQLFLVSGANTVTWPTIGSTWQWLNATTAPTLNTGTYGGLVNIYYDGTMAIASYSKVGAV